MEDSILYWISGWKLWRIHQSKKSKLLRPLRRKNTLKEAKNTKKPAASKKVKATEKPKYVAEKPVVNENHATKVMKAATEKNVAFKIPAKKPAKKPAKQSAAGKESAEKPGTRRH